MSWLKTQLLNSDGTTRDVIDGQPKKACSHGMDCEEKQVQRFDKQIKSMNEGIKKVTTRPPRGVLTFYCILRCSRLTPNVQNKICKDL